MKINSIIKLFLDTVILGSFYTLSAIIYIALYFKLKYGFYGIEQFYDINDYVIKFSLITISNILFITILIILAISLAKRILNGQVFNSVMCRLLFLSLLGFVIFVNYFLFFQPEKTYQFYSIYSVRFLPLYTYLYTFFSSLILVMAMNQLKVIIKDTEIVHLLTVICFGFLLLTTMFSLAYERTKYPSIIDYQKFTIEYSDGKRETINLIKRSENYVLVIHNKKIEYINNTLIKRMIQR